MSKRCDICGCDGRLINNSYYDINGYQIDDSDIEANAQNPDALAHYLCDQCYEEFYDKIFGGNQMNNKEWLDQNVVFIPAMGAKHVDTEEKLLAIADSIVDVKNTTATEKEIMENEHTFAYLFEEYDIQWYKETRGLLSIYAHTPVVAEEKIDGFSYLGTYGGEVVSKSLSTAKGTKGMPVIKSGHVPQIAQFVKYVWNEFGADIHMEIYKPGGNSDDVTSILGCTQEKALQRQKENGNLYAMVHDIRSFRGKNTTYEPYYIRRAILDYIFYKLEHTSRELVDMEFIKLSEVRVSGITEWFNEIIDRGGEGIMLKYTNARYFPDKKPANVWVKWKKEITLDVVIIGINDNGTGKNKDMFGSIKIGLYNDETHDVYEVGQCNSGISDDLRKQIWEDKDHFKGRVIEVDAMEMTKTGNLRHARFVRFRDDKEINQCTTDGLRIKKY